ncbi:MAG: SDR family oxidoreductase [Bacillota bacterium]|nr:SDR family oxidoreductase [Bacillota bacterium]
MIIAGKAELRDILKGKIILLTGAGGGIGFEAAKAFAYMGAQIVIAEIDHNKGSFAENYINSNFQNKLAKYYEIDLANEKQLNGMVDFIIQNYGCPDIIFNNATITKIGAVDAVEIEFWDKSYAVNLKAPLLLTQKFLPLMKMRQSGTIVFVSSSGASPYMGAYEVFKTAQVELSNTLAMELENSGVYTFTIGPGLVKTETAMNAIEIVAKSMGISTDEFYEMNRQHIIDAESAGTGFALSVINPERYHGQEIGSIQVLMDYDIFADNKTAEDKLKMKMTKDESGALLELLIKIQEAFEQQYAGWRDMNIFERQWVLRDFKKSMGMSAEQACEKLNMMLQQAQSDISDVMDEHYFFSKLCNYWKHQMQLLHGYEKDKNKLAENTKIINVWIKDIECLLNYMK